MVTWGQLTHCSMVSCQSLCNSSCLESFCRPRSWSILYASTARNRETEKTQNDEKGDIWDVCFTFLWIQNGEPTTHKQTHEPTNTGKLIEWLKPELLFLPLRCHRDKSWIPTERTVTVWGKAMKQCGNTVVCWQWTVTRKPTSSFDSKLYGYYL